MEVRRATTRGKKDVFIGITARRSSKVEERSFVSFGTQNRSRNLKTEDFIQHKTKEGGVSAEKKRRKEVSTRPEGRSSPPSLDVSRLLADHVKSLNGTMDSPRAAQPPLLCDSPPAFERRLVSLGLEIVSVEEKKRKNQTTCCSSSRLHRLLQGRFNQGD